MKIDVARYALLYSIYSWPSVVLTVVGAVLINRFLGCRCGTVLFMLLLCVGQSLFAVGAFVGAFWLMMTARFLIGIGGEIAFTMTDAFAAQWFRGKEVTLAFGIVGSFCRLGGAGGLYVNNIVYNFCGAIPDRYFQLGATLSFTVGVIVIATVFSIVLAIMDKHAEKGDRKTCKKEESKFSFKELLNFSVNFWIVCIVCVLYMSTIFPFVAIAQMFLRSKFGLSIDFANSLDLLIFLIPIGTPLLGMLINYTGFNVYWSFGGILVAFSAHLLYLLSSRSWFIPFIANSLLGMSFGCVNTAFWAAPSLLVGEHQLVTAYGMLEAGSNLGFAVTDIVSGQLIDNCGYFIHQLFFLFVLVVAIFLTIYLIFNLWGTDNPVNLSGWKKRKNNRVKMIDSNDYTTVN